MAILFGQVLPNTLSPLIVTASLLVANAILIESALSFLGLGAPNLMSWGSRSAPAARFCAMPGGWSPSRAIAIC